MTTMEPLRHMDIFATQSWPNHWEFRDPKMEVPYKMVTPPVISWFIIPLTILVGGFNPSEKYQSIGMMIPNIWKNKTCSKPPTSQSRLVPSQLFPSKPRPEPIERDRVLGRQGAHLVFSEGHTEFTGLIDHHVIIIYDDTKYHNDSMTILNNMILIL